MAGGQDLAHDTLYRALHQPLALFFEPSLGLCKGVGGLDRGYLLLIRQAGPAEGPGRLHGGLGFGLSLAVLAWTEGKRRIPPAFLPCFEEEGRLALAPLGWARAAGLRPEGVLFDAWYAAKWPHAHGGSFVTEGVQPRRHGGARWVKAGAIHRLRRAIEGIFRGLQRELGWTGHRHWRRARPLACGRIERRRAGLGLSFYRCRRGLIAGKLSLDLSPLLPVQVEAA